MRERIIFLFPIAVCCLALGGCGLRTLNAITSKSGFDQTLDIAYGPDPRHKLDLYTPARSAGDAPAVIFFYGGTWMSGSKDDYLYIAAALTARGIVTVIPDYRLYPRV